MQLNEILNIFLCVLMGATVAAASVPLVHMLQLESYQGRMYLKWLKKHISSDVVPYLFAGVAALLLRASYPFLGGADSVLARICFSAADFVYIAILAIFYFSYQNKPHVKPIVYTGRVIRFLVAECVIAFLFAALFFMKLYSWQYGMDWWTYLSPYMLRYAPGALLPVFVFAVYLVLYPLEEGIKRWYFNDAKKKLAKHEGLIRIGITGSYGKTGTKYALCSMLSPKYETLITPGSYNTPMGVTRVVRTSLEPSHKVFVAEMGARYKGDIKELCRLVHPEYGIITAVGSQHLETFGTLDRVRETKGELLAGIIPGGCCFLNGDDENCRRLYDESRVEGKYLYGTQGEDLYMRAEDIQTGPSGSTFTLRAQDGASVKCSTKLLGKYNILNMTGAAALAYKLGISLETIASAIAVTEPVEHRLQLIEGAVTVIDDAFNANPLGSAEALRVLSSFGGRKIIVTPGMVELGAQEEALNREFGANIAKTADIAIIIGLKHADPICEGITAAGFPENCIVRAETLAEATELLKRYTEPGCTVLFENDLPDNYAQ